MVDFPPRLSSILTDVQQLAGPEGRYLSVIAAKDILSLVDTAVSTEDIEMLQALDTICYRDLAPPVEASMNSVGFIDLSLYVGLIADAVRNGQDPADDPYLVSYRSTLEKDIQSVAGSLES